MNDSRMRISFEHDPVTLAMFKSLLERRNGMGKSWKVPHLQFIKLISHLTLEVGKMKERESDLFKVTQLGEGKAGI
jgi:hypothetical protein